MCLTQSEIRCADLSSAQCFQCVCIEGMQRLTLLKHHQVRDVDHRIDRIHTGSDQSSLQPLR